MPTRGGQLVRSVATALSLVVPGLGQLLRGRWLPGLLLLWLSVWLRTLLAGVAMSIHQPDLAVDAWLLGALALPRGDLAPVATVFTVVVAAVHVLAALDARREDRVPAAPNDDADGVEAVGAIR